MKALQPDDNEVKELRNHVIIAGYGRAGQIIASMLSELLIPFVALDVRSDRCVRRLQEGSAGHKQLLTTCVCSVFQNVDCTSPPLQR
jgi:voltage-gated potassium channel Kch